MLNCCEADNFCNGRIQGEPNEFPARMPGVEEKEADPGTDKTAAEALRSPPGGVKDELVIGGVVPI